VCAHQEALAHVVRLLKDLLPDESQRAAFVKALRYWIDYSDTPDA
jgi:hypothetical protein